MKVYIVHTEPYHENGDILGVFHSLEAAEASQPKETWERESWWTENRDEAVSSNILDSSDSRDQLVIYEFEADQ